MKRQAVHWIRQVVVKYIQHLGTVCYPDFTIGRLYYWFELPEIRILRFQASKPNAFGLLILETQYERLRTL
jgi:hypothetical protein